MDDTDEYRVGSLWRHKTTDQLVRVCGSGDDSVMFVYDNDATAKEPFLTSKPIFEVFYEKVDPFEEGLIYLSKM